MSIASTKQKEAQRKLALDKYIAKVLESSPPLTPEQLDRIAVIMHGGQRNGTHQHSQVHQESSRAIEIRKAKDALTKTQQHFREALDGCFYCELSRNVHVYQRGHGLGYHEFVELTPTDTIKVATTYKALIAKAERALEKAKSTQ